MNTPANVGDILEVREGSLNMGRGGGAYFFVSFEGGGRHTVFREVGRGGHLFFARKSQN